MFSKPINNLTLINKELPTSTKIWSNLEPLLPKFQGEKSGIENFDNSRSTTYA